MDFKTYALFRSNSALFYLLYPSRPPTLNLRSFPKHLMFHLLKGSLLFFRLSAGFYRARRQTNWPLWFQMHNLVKMKKQFIWTALLWRSHACIYTRLSPTFTFLLSMSKCHIFSLATQNHAYLGLEFALLKGRITDVGITSDLAGVTNRNTSGNIFDFNKSVSHLHDILHTHVTAHFSLYNNLWS